ncbi:MAG: hypothetical protein JXB26_09850 [Candidatus Aminicenantes bacterium]|nr:hypothetical protein [Candidatus Aminicenantes bacterium]
MKKLLYKKNAVWFLILCFAAFSIAYSEETDKEKFPVSAALSLNLSGYIQTSFTHYQNSNDEFQIKKARIGLDGDVSRHLSFKLQVDFVNNLSLIDALIETKFASYAKMTVGQYKIPFSLENLTSSHSLDTISRSLTVESLCPGRDIGAKGRDIGIMFSGRHSLFEYFLGIFNGTGINNLDNNEKKDFAGRLVLAPFDFLSMGISHYRGQNNSPTTPDTVDRNRTGLELYVHHGPFSLKGEYILARDDRTKKAGWYLQAGVFFQKEKIQAIIKYDSLDENTDIREKEKSRITLGLNWYFTRRTKLQINYEYREERSAPTQNVIMLLLQAGF